MFGAVRPPPEYFALACRRYGDVLVCTGAILDGKGKVGAGSDAGMRLIANAARVFLDRARFRGGPQKPFIGGTLGIKAQHVGNRRPRVQQRDGKVAIVAGSECSKSRHRADPRLHRGFKGAMRSDSVVQRRHPGRFGCSAGVRI